MMPEFRNYISKLDQFRRKIMSDSEEFWSADEDDSVNNNNNKLPSKRTNGNRDSKLTNGNRDSIENIGNGDSIEISEIPNSVHKSENTKTAQTSSQDSITDLQDGNAHTYRYLTDVDREVGRTELQEKGFVVEQKEKGEKGTEGKDEKIEVPVPEIGPEELERIKSEVLERKEAGNNLFRSGEFALALEAYSSGLEKSPSQLRTEKSVLLSNRSLCRVRMGEEQLALADCSEALVLVPGYTKVRIRRAQLSEQLGKLEEALDDYSQVLKADPTNREARNAVPRLTVEVEKQREAMKEEAISKLKDLGNLILSPFGISTEDFKFVQDPNTGGYNVSFGKKS